MIDKALLKLPGAKKMLGLLVGLAFLQAIFIIGQAFFLALAITHLWEGQVISEQWRWLALFLVAYSARQGIIFSRDRLLDRFAEKNATKLRNELLQQLFYLGPKIVQERGTGSMTTMALEGIHQVEEYLHLIFAKIVNLMLIPWIILVAVFLLDWRSGLTLLLVFPLIILFMIILGYAAQSKADKQYQTFQLLSNHFIDSLRGIDTLKYFGLSKNYSESIFKTSERFRKATMNTLKIAILSTFALDFFTTLSVAVVAVFLGLRLIEVKILLFPALTVLILAPEYFLPIRDFAGDYHATLDGKNAFSAIQTILALQKPPLKSQQLPVWQATSQLVLTDVAFTYDQKPALSQISLAVKGYKKIGIIGMSGSGKSTLINLLSGFLRPDQGKIQLDQQQITAFEQADWQKQLIYLPQNPYIFQLSIRENVAFYTPDASEAEILAAIDAVGLTSLVQELPQGLDTILGEGERNLSGGQAQRIALARSFLDRKRKILLFDEPTAHLDIETEVELKEKMLPLMKDHLVFFATHRLHWAKEMDYLLVMEHGQIVEQGTLAELLARKGAFVRLVTSMRGERT